MRTPVRLGAALFWLRSVVHCIPFVEQGVHASDAPCPWTS